MAKAFLMLALAAILPSCQSGSDVTVQRRDSSSARTEFGRDAAALLLDTTIHELRGQLSVKVRNTNPNDPEAPLVDRPVTHPADPGPHTYLGVMHAEIGSLRALLGDTIPVAVEDDRVFLGRPEVLLIGHRHGADLYVPVRLFAHAYGAYVRTHCPLANCADVWPHDILLYMKNAGFLHSAGVLDGYLEGLLKGINVRRLPTG